MGLSQSGLTCSIKPQPSCVEHPVPVLLHVYSLSRSSGIWEINDLLRPAGLGVFHAGVEVYSAEYSFSDVTDEMVRAVSTGVFVCLPRKCTEHNYLESYMLYNTFFSEASVAAIVRHMSDQWPARDYHLLRRNCLHFCEEFSRRLGAGDLPDKIARLIKTFDTVTCSGNNLEHPEYKCECPRLPQGAHGMNERGMSCTSELPGHDAFDSRFVPVPAQPIVREPACVAAAAKAQNAMPYRLASPLSSPRNALHPSMAPQLQLVAEVHWGI